MVGAGNFSNSFLKFSAGTFNTNNNTMTIGGISYNAGSSVCNVNWGSSVIGVSGWTGPFTPSTNPNLTVDVGTSVVNFAGGYVGSNPTLFPFYTLNYTSNFASAGSDRFYGFTCVNLNIIQTYIGTAIRPTLTVYNDFTVTGTLTYNARVYSGANTSGRLEMISDTAGVQRNITLGNPPNTSYLIVKDLNFINSSTYTLNNASSLGNVTGINIPSYIGVGNRLRPAIFTPGRAK
jgi:hypothetical protein